MASGSSAPPSSIAVAVLDQDVAFKNRLCELLDEQRVAVGLGDNLVHHFGRQRVAVGDLRNNGFNIAAVEAPELYDADIRQTHPWRLEFRPKRKKSKGRYLAQSIDHEIEQFERGGIGPMRVLEQEQDRFLTREPFKLIEECRQRAAKLLRGTERQGRIPAAQWDRQQRS